MIRNKILKLDQKLILKCQSCFAFGPYPHADIDRHKAGDYLLATHTGPIKLPAEAFRPDTTSRAAPEYLDLRVGYREVYVGLRKRPQRRLTSATR